MGLGGWACGARAGVGTRRGVAAFGVGLGVRSDWLKRG